MPKPHTVRPVEEAVVVFCRRCARVSESHIARFLSDDEKRSLITRQQAGERIKVVTVQQMQRETRQCLCRPMPRKPDEHGVHP